MFHSRAVNRDPEVFDKWGFSQESLVIQSIRISEIAVYGDTRPRSSGLNWREEEEKI